MDTHRRRLWPLQTNTASQEAVRYRHILFHYSVLVQQLWNILCRTEGLIRNGVPGAPICYQRANECDQQDLLQLSCHRQERDRVLTHEAMLTSLSNQRIRH